MKARLTIPALLVGLLCAARPALAGFVDGEGFGIRSGTPVSQLGVLASPSADPSSRVVPLESVPQPHPLLTRYHLEESVETGVCAVSGVAEPKPPARADDVLQALLRELVEAFGEADERVVRTRSRRPDLPPTAFGGPDVELREETFRWRRASLTRAITLERRLWSTGPVAILSFEFANALDCARGRPTRPARP